MSRDAKSCKNLVVKRQFVGSMLISAEFKSCFPARLINSVVVLRNAVLIFVFMFSGLAHGAPVNDSINLSGILFPCMNCSLKADGEYHLNLNGEEFLLRPYEARRKLFEETVPEKLSQLNKPGEILRFLLSQDVRMDEAEKALLAFLQSEGGRSTLILSFESIYRSHSKAVLKLIVAKKFPVEVMDGIKSSLFSSSDNSLNLTLLALAGPQEAKQGLYRIIEESLDQDLDVTLERVGELEKSIAAPEIASVTSMLSGLLTEIKSALSKTSALMSSAYSEAGLKPELKRIMRKQRLLTLTGKALQANETTAPELLRELTFAYDSTLDTPVIHEAFRHLVSLVPNASEILGSNREELMARDPSLHMMLNPPPTIENSLLAIAAAVSVCALVGIFALISWRKRWKLEQKLDLTEGLSFEERRELTKILQRFGVSADPTLQELQSAFRRLAKKIHPDAKNGSQTDESFIKLQEEYQRAKELISAFKR